MVRTLAAWSSAGVRWPVVDAVARIARPVDADHHVGGGRMGGVTVIAWIVEEIVVVEFGEAGAVGYGTADLISICPHHLLMHGKIENNSELHENSVGLSTT